MRATAARPRRRRDRGTLRPQCRPCTIAQARRRASGARRVPLRSRRLRRRRSGSTAAAPCRPPGDPVPMWHPCPQGRRFATTRRRRGPRRVLSALRPPWTPWLQGRPGPRPRRPGRRSPARRCSTPSRRSPRRICVHQRGSEGRAGAGRSPARGARGLSPAAGCPAPTIQAISRATRTCRRGSAGRWSRAVTGSPRCPRARAALTGRSPWPTRRRQGPACPCGQTARARH